MSCVQCPQYSAQKLRVKKKASSKMQVKLWFQFQPKKRIMIPISKISQIIVNWLNSYQPLLPPFATFFCQQLKKRKYGFSEIKEESISSKCLTQLTAYVVCVIGGWRSAQLSSRSVSTRKRQGMHCFAA